MCGLNCACNYSWEFQRILLPPLWQCKGWLFNISLLVLRKLDWLSKVILDILPMFPIGKQRWVTHGKEFHAVLWIHLLIIFSIPIKLYHRSLARMDLYETNNYVFGLSCWIATVKSREEDLKSCSPLHQHQNGTQGQPRWTFRFLIFSISCSREWKCCPVYDTVTFYWKKLIKGFKNTDRVGNFWELRISGCFENSQTGRIQFIHSIVLTKTPLKISSPATAL